MNIDQKFNDVLKNIDFILDLQEAAYKDGFNKKNDILEYSKEVVFDYLKVRGYVRNTYQNKVLFTKGFVCVVPYDDSLVIWHDVPNSYKQVITKSKLTHLPILLKYMESYGMGN